jgi:hypothetical protein
MSRFETEILSSKENLKHLIDLSGKWIDQAHRHRKFPRLIQDRDSSVSKTHAHQARTAYKGEASCAGGSSPRRNEWWQSVLRRKTIAMASSGVRINR